MPTGVYKRTPENSWNPSKYTLKALDHPKSTHVDKEGKQLKLNDTVYTLGVAPGCSPDARPSNLRKAKVIGFRGKLLCLLDFGDYQQFKRSYTVIRYMKGQS